MRERMALSQPLSAPMSPSPRAYRGWLSYAAAWAAAAGLWALAAASSSGMSPLMTLPYGILIMSVSAAVGVLVWRLTGRLPLRGRGFAFYASHAIALVLYAFIYTIAVEIPVIVRGDLTLAARTIWHSPVFFWNVLLG